MNQRQEHQEHEELIKIKDKDIISLLILYGVEEAERIKEEGTNKTVFVYNKGDKRYQEVIEMWLSSRPIMVDAKALFSAIKTFNSKVHDNLI